MNKYIITNYEKLKPMEVIEFLGRDINKAGDEFDIEKLKEIIHYAENLGVENFSSEEKCIFYYYLSNAWANLTNQKIAPEDIPFICNEQEKQIFYLRLSIKHFGHGNSPFQKAQVYVNLGNSYDHIGRFVEAHRMWNKALEIYPNFGMAICNIGHGILRYARYIDDKTQILYFQEAHNVLNSSLMYKDIGITIKVQIKDLVNNIRNVIGEHNLSLNFNWDNCNIGSTDNEIKYREWSLENKLFLNSLNDITTRKIAAEDDLFLPSITYKKEDYPSYVYQNIFNQIKQEYVSARCFLYEAIFCQEKHYSDKNNYLMDMFDYSIYSYNMEKAKAAYRICYSIFDKIAYLLIEYFRIEIKPHEINFNKIWYKNRKNKQLREQFENSQNWAIKGLYWVSKDLSSKEQDFITDPDSEDIADIRNFIEHKSFKIIDYNFGGGIKKIDNELTLQISREEFEEKALKLLSLVRASIIYLCKGIYIEEEKNKLNGFVVPIEYPEIDEEYKI